MKIPDAFKNELRKDRLDAMPFHEKRYVIPWAFDRHGDRLECRMPDCPTTDRPAGTSSLGVTRTGVNSYDFDFSHLDGWWEGWNDTKEQR